MLDDGTCATLGEIAAAERITPSYVSRILRLNLLAPDLLEAILDGTADHRVMLERRLAANWEDQRRLLAQSV